MNVILILVISISTSLFTSFLMMKYHLRMIEKWMDNFFKKEEEYIKKLYK